PCSHSQSTTPANPGPLPSPFCARLSTPCSTTPSTRPAAMQPAMCRSARGHASVHGTSRAPSLPVRPPPRRLPATRSRQSPPRRPAHAVRVLHVAGGPTAAPQLLRGRGETVGATVVADTRVRGVMFTGSTEVATLINRTLAERGGHIPLIAETGGQNAMIVD